MKRGLEQECLDGTTKQLLECEQVLMPKWRRRVEDVNRDWSEREELLKAAQRKAAQVTKEKQDTEFACKIISDRLLAVDEKEAGEDMKRKLREAKVQWEILSDNIAKYNTSISEFTILNKEMSAEAMNLEQENIALREELATANHRKRVQAGAMLSGRKRLKELQDAETSAQTRNIELKHQLDILDGSSTVGSQFGKLLLLHQSLVEEINSLSTISAEIELQNELESIILLEAEAGLKEASMHLLTARQETMQDDAEIHRLQIRIREIEEELQRETAEEQDFGNTGRSPEARDLWQECVCLQNKNNHIAKNIELMKMERKL